MLRLAPTCSCHRVYLLYLTPYNPWHRATGSSFFSRAGVGVSGIPCHHLVLCAPEPDCYAALV